MDWWPCWEQTIVRWQKRGFCWLNPPVSASARAMKAAGIPKPPKKPKLQKPRPWRSATDSWPTALFDGPNWSKKVPTNSEFHVADPIHYIHSLWQWNLDNGTAGTAGTGWASLLLQLWYPVPGRWVLKWWRLNTAEHASLRSLLGRNDEEWKGYRTKALRARKCGMRIQSLGMGNHFLQPTTGPVFVCGQDPVVSQISRLEWLNWDWTEQHWKSPWHMDPPGLLPRDTGMHTSASGKDLRPKSGCQTGDIQHMFQPWFGEWKLRQVVLLATSQPTGKYGACEHKGFPSPKRACPIKIKNCSALLIFFCLKKGFFRKCPTETQATRQPGLPPSSTCPDTLQRSAACAQHSPPRSLRQRCGKSINLGVPTSRSRVNHNTGFTVSHRKLRCKCFRTPGPFPKMWKL